jgi:hypothetical protein
MAIGLCANLVLGLSRDGASMFVVTALDTGICWVHEFSP